MRARERKKKKKGRREGWSEERGRKKIISFLGKEFVNHI